VPATRATVWDRLLVRRYKWLAGQWIGQLVAPLLNDQGEIGVAVDIFERRQASVQSCHGLILLFNRSFAAKPLSVAGDREVDHGSQPVSFLRGLFAGFVDKSLDGASQPNAIGVNQLFD
jgi:hypothetical protein